MEITVEQVREKIVSFYDELEGVQEFKVLPYPIKSYFELNYEPERLKQSYIVAMCFKKEPAFSQDYRIICVGVFSKWFPHPLGTPVLMTVSCGQIFPSLS
jgi:hypothetical protein